MGALHGLNPLTGWGLATACSLRATERTAPLRALLPLAAGHLASVALVVAMVVWGLSLSRPLQLVLAGSLCAVGALALARWPGCGGLRWRKPAGSAGMALWSFGVATAHGAGLALVPALAPLCLVGSVAGGAAAGGSASSALVLQALAALGVHTAAMLAVTGAMAATACSGVQRAQRWLQHHRGYSGGPAR